MYKRGLRVLATICAALLLALSLAGCSVLEIVQEILNEMPEPSSTSVQHVQGQDLSLYVLETGKSDSLLLTCGGESMIVDGGNDDDEQYILNTLQELGITQLKYLFNTHPHEDHLGSLDAVARTIPIQNALLSQQTHTTRAYESLLEALENAQVPTDYAYAGDTFILGDASITVLSAKEGELYEEMNDNSLVLMVQKGNVRYLLMGDAESPVEKELIQAGISLKADVLKMGHHGSDTSSKKAFLQAVQPRVALITCDESKTSGAPSSKVVERLEALEIEFLRTDRAGRLHVMTDGEEITVSTQR